MTMHYKLDPFFNFLNEEREKKPNELAEAAPANFYKIRDKKRELLKTVIGLDKLERYAFDTSCNRCTATKVSRARIIPHGEERSGDWPDISIERFGMEILPGLTMPFYIIRSSCSSAQKAVLYCHGHGEGGLRDCFVNAGQYHKNMPHTLAMRGYTVFAFEPAGFGHFKIDDYANQDETRCHSLSMRLLLYGMTALGLRVFQTKCLADHMRANYSVNKNAIVGISGGGTVCMLYGAIYDDVFASVISCYSNTFKASIMAMHHCICNAVPGIMEAGDIPDIIAMSAPKKLFLQSGINDPIYPVDGARSAYAFVKSIYEKLGIPENVKSDFFDGAHEFNNSLIDWLDSLE